MTFIFVKFQKRSIIEERLNIGTDRKTNEWNPVYQSFLEVIGSFSIQDVERNDSRTLWKSEFMGFVGLVSDEYFGCIFLKQADSISIFI